MNFFPLLSLPLLDILPVAMYSMIFEPAEKLSAVSF
jgi:hypothetical protein